MCGLQEPVLADRPAGEGSQSHGGRDPGRGRKSQEEGYRHPRFMTANEQVRLAKARVAREAPFVTPVRQAMVGFNRRINNLSVSTELAAEAAIAAAEGLRREPEGAERYFALPNAKGTEFLSPRTAGVMMSMLHRIGNRELLEHSLSLIVSETERTLGEFVRLALTQNAELLGTEKTVKLHRIFAAESLDELRARLIHEQVQGLFFGRPSEYLSEIEKLLGVRLGKDMKLRYYELKATRDVCTHNAGRANEIYLAKAGELARAFSGALVPVDADYLSKATTCVKRIVNHVGVSLQKKHGAEPLTLG